MSQELRYQRLLEEFGSAFNVEGLTEIQITWQGKGKILEGIVDRARWWLGLGNRNQEPQNYQQAIMGVREAIAANTNDSRFISLSTSWPINVSRSFFDKVCSLVEESERRKAVEKLGLQKKSSGQRSLLPAPAPSVQPSSSVAANTPQSTPFFLQETSSRLSQPPSPPDNPAPVNTNGPTSNRKRKFSEDSAVAKRGGKNKGKRRAIPGTYSEVGATIAESLTVGPIEQNLLRGIPSPVGIGGAGPSKWDSSLKGSGIIHHPIQFNGSTGSKYTALAPNQQNSRASSQKTANSISKTHSQFLLRIRKANLAALSPSQRVQLNLCISQANHLEGVSSIPLIGNTPKLHCNTSSSAHSSSANLVRDCQNALSLATPLLPSPTTATPVDSAPSGTIESPPPKSAKTHKSLGKSSEQHWQKRLSQEMPPLRNPKMGPATSIGASTNTEGTYIHAAGSESDDCLATAVLGNGINLSEPMPIKASPLMLSPSVPQFPLMAPMSPLHDSRSPSRSIQQPGAIQQAASVPMSAASSPSVPTARCPSDDIGFSGRTLQAPLDLSLLPPYYQPKQHFPGSSANPIYNTIHLHPIPAAISSSLIGSQGNEISGNDNILNGYDQQVFFSQYLNIPTQDYIGGQELHGPQSFFEPGNQMGSGMEQLQSTISPMYGQHMVDFSQQHFQGMPEQGGIHMSYISYMSLTGNQLIPPYQFLQQMQWAQDNFQAWPLGSEGHSDQNPIALD
ncbi:hypothetical protein BGX38DRAFT_1266708 [Terfezia claveryi]|nr:hypothetical protein BGX38DRAFT_1266708 [Terfezia claveryi]